MSPTTVHTIFIVGCETCKCVLFIRIALRDQDRGMNMNNTWEHSPENWVHPNGTKIWWLDI